MSEKKYHFGFEILKKNPKKNAKFYELVTVQDIYAILTEENINKFMREFKIGMKVSVAMRDLMIAKGIKSEDVPKMESFTWIDD